MRKRFSSLSYEPAPCRQHSACRYSSSLDNTNTRRRQLKSFPKEVTLDITGMQNSRPHPNATQLFFPSTLQIRTKHVVIRLGRTWFIASYRFYLYNIQVIQCPVIRSDPVTDHTGKTCHNGLHGFGWKMLQARDVSLPRTQLWLKPVV